MAFPDSLEYRYVQVADDLAFRIVAGDIAPGRRLPSERTLADRYGASYGTLRRAMQELRARELIVTTPGRGTFVRA
jgi:GntR family transcriptional regulator